MIPVLLACLLIGLWVILTCSCIACFLWTIFWSRIIYRYICQFDLKSCPWYVQYMLWIHVLNLGFLAYFGLDTNSQYNASPYLLLFLQSSSNLKKNVYIWNSHIIKYCRMKNYIWTYNIYCLLFFLYFNGIKTLTDFKSEKPLISLWILRFYLMWLMIFTTFSRLCLSLQTYLKHKIMTTNLQGYKMHSTFYVCY